MECPRCQAEEAIGAKYCGGCGRRVQLLSCQHCGAGNPPTSRFCHECGHALADEPALSPDAAHEVPSPEETEEETKDSAFWKAYADRTGIPPAGLIELAPVPEGARQESPAENRDHRRTPGRHDLRPPTTRARAPADEATLQEDRGRRPIGIVMAAGAILALVVIVLFLSMKPWQAVRGPERQESIAPSNDQSLASRPPHDPVPAPTASAPPREDNVPAEELRALSPQSPSSDVAPPAEPRRAPPTPRTSVERMAMFLLERDGPARAVHTALTVATFYPANTDDFKYWHRVAAAIRASTAPKEESGEAIRH